MTKGFLRLSRFLCFWAFLLCLHFLHVTEYCLGGKQRGTQGTPFTVWAHYLLDQHTVQESDSSYVMWRERSVLNSFPLGPLIHLAATSNESGF